MHCTSPCADKAGVLVKAPVHLQVGDVVRKTRAYVLKEGKSGEYAKKGHGARPFEDYIPIMFPCDGEVCADEEASELKADARPRWHILYAALNVVRAAWQVI